MSQFGGGLSKLVQLKRILDGVWGRNHHLPETREIWRRSPQPLEDFNNFFGKK